MSDTLTLAKQLIEKPSVTPDDQGCQTLIAERLDKKGFHSESIPFNDVKNLWVSHGTEGPVVTFLGHTDVVPAGPREEWYSDPFTPTIRENSLYGRGACDMKSSVAAMVVACERFVEHYPNHSGTLSILLTSDEEGIAKDGIRRVMESFVKQQPTIDYCIVGEPTCTDQLGDTVEIGRRGSLSGTLTLQGMQGHVAYPQLADNPIHRFAHCFAELCGMTWDTGNEHFPPTSFQVSNIQSGTGANNVIPGVLSAQFNFRYSPEVTAEILQQKLEAILDKHQAQYQIDWHHSGKPFYTAPGDLTDKICRAVHDVTGIKPILSTTGGTSDGRFVAPTGAQVVEFGPSNRTIHQVNENILVDDIEKLTAIYFKMLEELLV